MHVFLVPNVSHEQIVADPWKNRESEICSETDCYDAW